MATVEELRGKIDTAESLQSVVSTMKTLAAVNERQFEIMVEAIAEYNRTVELGLQVVLKDRPTSQLRTASGTRGRLAAIIIGSDQGMCGPFSQRIVEHALLLGLGRGLGPGRRGQRGQRQPAEKQEKAGDGEKAVHVGSYR